MNEKKPWPRRMKRTKKAIIERKHVTTLTQNCYRKPYENDCIILRFIMENAVKKETKANVGHVETILQPGEAAFSLRQIAKATGLTYCQVRCSIIRMEARNEIDRKPIGKRYTILSVPKNNIYFSEGIKEIKEENKIQNWIVELAQKDNGKVFQKSVNDNELAPVTYGDLRKLLA